MNLITEAALIGLPTKIVWNVHISRQRKFVVIGCFAARIAYILVSVLFKLRKFIPTNLLGRVIGPIIAQLTQLTGLRSTTDITFDSWPYYISNQLVLNLSVLTVCVPSIKNFLIGLESGMIQIGDFHLRKTGTTSANSGSINPTSSSNNTHPNLPTRVLTINSNNLSENNFAPSGNAGGKQSSDGSHSINEDTVGVLLPTHINNVAHVAQSSSSENSNCDDGSFASKPKIVKTTEWRVDYQLLT